VVKTLRLCQGPSESNTKYHLKSQRGRVQSNIPRWVAMYLSQEISSHKLREIAITFNLKRTESIPTTIAKLKVLLEDNLRLKRRVKKIIREYDT